MWDGSGQQRQEKEREKRKSSSDSRCFSSSTHTDIQTYIYTYRHIHKHIDLMCYEKGKHNDQEGLNLCCCWRCCCCFPHNICNLARGRPLRVRKRDFKVWLKRKRLAGLYNCFLVLSLSTYYSLTPFFVFLPPLHTAFQPWTRVSQKTSRQTSTNKMELTQFLFLVQSLIQSNL